MESTPWYVETSCRACGDARVLNEALVVRTLQHLGMLRRAPEAEVSLLLELLQVAGPRLVCEACGAAGLGVREAEEAAGNWGGSRACEQCGGAISRERLEALPEATRCAACQGSDEKRGPADTPEYCRHCGAILQIRQVAGRVTRYALKCPECGR